MRYHSVVGLHDLVRKKHGLKDGEVAGIDYFGADASP